MISTKSQVMVVERATEKVDNLEKKIQWLLGDHYLQLTQVFTTIKMSRKPIREEHSVDVHIEGGSSHHIHFHGDHQSSSHWTPKLDMYKFDGSDLEICLAQME